MDVSEFIRGAEAYRAFEGQLNQMKEALLTAELTPEKWVELAEYREDLPSVAVLKRLADSADAIAKEVREIRAIIVRRSAEAARELALRRSAQGGGL